jgi:hypothetical protein
MKPAIVFIGCAVFLTGLAQAQQDFTKSAVLPDAPSAHKFWNLSNTVIFAIFSAEQAADAITTQRGLNHGMREDNPLARPFVAKGAAGQSAGSALSLAAGLGTTYLLHRTNHHKAERVVVRLLVIGEGVVVARNIAVVR